jgi:hypothetical protein
MYRPRYFSRLRARYTAARRTRNSWWALFMRGPGPAGGQARTAAGGLDLVKPADKQETPDSTIQHPFLNLEAK